MLVAALVLCAVALPAGVASQAPPPSVPISLDEAVSEALAHNLTLAAERARLPVADAARVTAALRPNPELAFSADHLEFAGYRFTEANGGGPSEYSLRTDYLWEQGGKRRRRIAVAEHERAVTRQEVADRERQLRYQVQSAFIDLLLAQRTLALAQDSLEAMRRVAQVSEARVKSGDLAEVELLRTRVAVLQIDNEVRERDLARRLARQRLAQLVGRGAGADLEAAGDFVTAGRTLPPLAEAERRALTQRADLLALAAEQQRAEADYHLQRALGRVDFTLGAEYRRQQGVNGRSNSLGFFLTAPLQLFDRNQGEAARARAEAAQAARRLEALRASIAGEVREAYLQHETAQDLLRRIETQMLGDARQVRSITEYAYQRGEASLVEFLDAQRAFNDTMQSHVSARAEFARSLYLIEAVSGKGDLQ